ncbi:mannose-1-phosphate guanylyltransferase/mannose-6-phosphate isomerase [Halothiobacillus diazotrophicus]|uniref:mannose-1-phosphate guanylyltransferase n=1 Tax=Halothiobacillus diazotrophicus TaxID=1860122 RepID=A0A191ZFD0_9GAMM|nr:mannose-1-phosphate guanylyltransferase/mannose-6-phosphate isomerase [Halothiobacillus diazotrophicus]ANJ66589.1 mannose-1-phosphate guanylyltransferase/mannose-6-phosphate isomerase [Halothiobacillus diazotrophicus]
MTNALFPVILCGGAGSRLWPLSRELHPKPFIRLPDGQSLLQKAFLRAAGLTGTRQVITVTNRDLVFKIEDELNEVNQDNLAISLILEPSARNTAAAIASAALMVARKDPQALLLVLAADHLIENKVAFEEAVNQAKQLAEKGRLVTFGIKPNQPETGYGYIEYQENQVIRFVEKPDLPTAIEFVASERFLWNSGMFCFKAQTVLDELDKYAPEILDAVRETISHSKISQGVTNNNDFFHCELNADDFTRVPEESFDYAVMERTENAAVVPSDIGWSDIGSWQALGAIGQTDGSGNRLDGEVIMHDVHDCYIRSDNRLVGAVGVENLVIIDTPDALLVAHKERSQEVKHLFKQLKTAGHEAHRLHRTVHRPWGTYTVLEERPDFKIKRIVVKPGATLSLQMHHHRSEHWVVVSGMAKVVNGNKEILLAANESTYIPAGQNHRLANPGMIDVVLIEVQTGQYLGEDDIVRIEDVYGRAPIETTNK